MRAFLPLICLILLSIQAKSQTSLPENIYGDSAYAPFYWGVASGDPTPDGVVIWTKVAGIPEPVIQTQTWELATDEAFTNIVSTGTVDALAMNDLTVRVEVDDLQPNTYFYYRFIDSESGQTSQVGRTKTAPIGDVDEFTIAVASCSSIYSGFFNGYRSIGNNDEIDLMAHLGDYIYDFVDSDEQVRVPEPYPESPENLQEWRDRHAYYLLDPDLRLARQMHPWVVIWDNHDFGDGTEGGGQAFWEYVPRRDYHNDIERIHRSYSFGNLLDLIMIDIEKFRNIDEVAPGESSVLTNAQREWFLEELGASDAKWRIVGNQKMFGGWYSDGIPEWLPIPNAGGVFDDGSWDGFMAERDTVLRFVEENEIDNFMVISGDVHMSFCMDLSRDPRNNSVYDGETGDGALGVEFIPTSISRGNFDESGIAEPIANIAADLSGGINPHHQFTNFTHHGYGIVKITPDTLTAQIWYSDKLQITNEQELGVEMLMLDGDNRWHRSGQNPSSIWNQKANDPMAIFPNPANETLNVRFKEDPKRNYLLRIFDTKGRIVLSSNSTGQRQLELSVSELIAGAYVLQASNEEKLFKKSFVISR